MTTEGANPPFREFSVTVTLRPREMPINWAIGAAQGRRDAALIEAALRTDPRTGFELVDPLTRIGQRRSRAKSGWSNLSIGGRELLLASDDERSARRILESVDPDALEPIAALHVTAGKQPGIAASVSVAPRAGELRRRNRPGGCSDGDFDRTAGLRVDKEPRRAAFLGPARGVVGHRIVHSHRRPAEAQVPPGRRAEHVEIGRAEDEVRRD